MLAVWQGFDGPETQASLELIIQGVGNSRCKAVAPMREAVIIQELRRYQDELFLLALDITREAELAGDVLRRTSLRVLSIPPAELPKKNDFRRYCLCLVENLAREYSRRKMDENMESVSDRESWLKTVEDFREAARDLPEPAQSRSVDLREDEARGTDDEWENLEQFSDVERLSSPTNKGGVKKKQLSKAKGRVQ